jgi:hypothetical protein
LIKDIILKLDIVEGRILKSSGFLKLEPGNYNVSVYSSNLVSVKEPDLVNDADNDYYRVELWKSDDNKAPS